MPVLPSRTIQGASVRTLIRRTPGPVVIFGYQSIISGEWYGEDSLMHAMVVGLGFIVLTAFIAHCFRLGARAMSDILLRLEDMCIRTPERALVDGVSFTLRRGKVTAVVGHSGSAKA